MCDIDCDCEGWQGYSFTRAKVKLEDRLSAISQGGIWREKPLIAVGAEYQTGKYPKQPP